MTNKGQSLTPYEKKIILHKGTERPGSGRYINPDQNKLKTFICRQCGIPLFLAESHFQSSCGWPSFDAEYQKNVKYLKDADGIRTEIVCQNCEGHLGHVFYGEGYTAKNQRFCVNSVSIEAVEGEGIMDTEEIIVAAGCFWGVETLFKQHPAVLLTEVGYIGGKTLNPSYEEVCSGKTGHLEAVRVIYNPKLTTLQNLYQYFFEIHDFQQTDGQGPDRGSQYLSAIFYYDSNQKSTAQKVINKLQHMNYNVATKLYPVNTFWPAEDYHQDYYAKTHKQPYCHLHKTIFQDNYDS